MADQPKKKGELLGQPWWVWAAGAGAILLGYWYFKTHSSQAAAGKAGQGSAGGRAAGGGGGSRLGVTFSDLNQWARDHQAPVRPRSGGGGTGGGGTGGGTGGSGGGGTGGGGGQTPEPPRHRRGTLPPRKTFGPPTAGG